MISYFLWLTRELGFKTEKTFTDFLCYANANAPIQGRQESEC